MNCENEQSENLRMREGSHMNTYQGWGTFRSKIIPIKCHWTSLI